MAGRATPGDPAAELSAPVVGAIGCSRENENRTEVTRVRNVEHIEPATVGGKGERFRPVKPQSKGTRQGDCNVKATCRDSGRFVIGAGKKRTTSQNPDDAHRVLSEGGY